MSGPAACTLSSSLTQAPAEEHTQVPTHQTLNHTSSLRCRNSLFLFFFAQKLLSKWNWTSVDVFNYNFPEGDNARSFLSMTGSP